MMADAGQEKLNAPSIAGQLASQLEEKTRESII
jgi:hypothetical protein